MLELNKVNISENYSKEWNIRENDFLIMFKNGEKINDTLYRLGGLNNLELNKDKYFILLKYVESFYDKELLKQCKCKDPKHFKGTWCIFNNKGEELKEFKEFESIYLLKDSCIYSVDNKYFNIENGEYYGQSSNTMQSEEFLFLDNSYNKDKKGILKINKNNGSFEIFK